MKVSKYTYESCGATSGGLHAGALIGAGVGGQHGAAQGTADVCQHRHLSALQVSHPFFVTQGAAMLKLGR